MHAHYIYNQFAFRTSNTPSIDNAELKLIFPLNTIWLLQISIDFSLDIRCFFLFFKTTEEIWRHMIKVSVMAHAIYYESYTSGQRAMNDLWSKPEVYPLWCIITFQKRCQVCVTKFSREYVAFKGVSTAICNTNICGKAVWGMSCQKEVRRAGTMILSPICSGMWLLVLILVQYSSYMQMYQLIQRFLVIPFAFIKEDQHCWISRADAGEVLINWKVTGILIVLHINIHFFFISIFSYNKRWYIVWQIAWIPCICTVYFSCRYTDFLRGCTF